jgi:hypothetical protein
VDPVDLTGYDRFQFGFSRNRNELLEIL